MPSSPSLSSPDLPPLPDQPVARELSDYSEVENESPVADAAGSSADVDSATPALPAVPGPVERLIATANCPHPLRNPFRFVGWCVMMLFGIATLIALLSLLAAIPIVNFVVLGYLLDVEGRVARSGRFRDAFPLLPLAPRVGGLALGVLLCLLPLQILSNIAADARLISAGSGSDLFLHRFLAVLAPLVAVHILMALARGGRFTMFLRPIKNLRWCLAEWRGGRLWNQSDTVLREFITRIEPVRLFKQGLLGFVGALAWLAIPTLIFAAANKPEGILALVTIFGGVCLAIVLSWAPFLQARFAAEGRFSAFRELRTIREMYRRAPVCWSLAVIVNFALSLPLYLATVVLPPRDGLQLVAVIFLVSIYPARVIVGWAYAQAAKRERRTWFSLRWLMSWLLMPTLAFYVFLLYFTQFIGSSGKLVLFQHHTLLLPIPY